MFCWNFGTASSACIAGFILASCASQPPPAPAPKPSESHARSQKDAFAVCDAESGMALAMARNYFLSGRKEDQVLAYVGNKEPGAGLAQKLFREAAAGTVKHHADFATETLLECAAREGMTLDKPQELVRLCFARVDIPFFLRTFRQQGLAKDVAITRVEGVLKDRTIYTEPLIQATAETAYAESPSSDARKLLGTVFWSCVYHDEWRRPS